MMRSEPDFGEAVLSSLRALYGRYGYSRYKMNQFEEYDLYARNKDFLISDSVITFTDGTGKLLALKPDVTLSIVKNSKDSVRLQKVFYNESVYRVNKGSRNFKEIMQVGLECIGEVDDYCVYEVLKLALGSLDLIHPSNVLSVSHLGILSEVMDYAGIPDGRKSDVLDCIGKKNLHELSAILRDAGIPDADAERLKRLTVLRGTPAEVTEPLRQMLDGIVRAATLEGFFRVLTALRDEKKLLVDFSVVGDLHYYNGFVFKGFVEGIPSGVLSGGQYDTLMRKMGKTSGAIGFAVYLDTVEQFFRRAEDYDADTVLLYDAAEDPGAVGREVEKRNLAGESVLAVREIPDGLKYRRVLRMKNGEVTDGGTDA